jgi:hypothetical protein
VLQQSFNFVGGQMARSSPYFRCLATVTFLLSLSSAGCYSTHHRRFDPDASLDSLTGITTRSGTEITFSRPGASIVRDTLFASGTVGPLKVPTDSVAQVTSHGFSRGGSLVVIGAFGAAALALLLISLGSSHGGT